MPTAFITGITGQDGSYLAELLLQKGYQVHGMLRRNSTFTSARIEHLFGNTNFHTHHGDLTDSSNVHQLLKKISPDEVYNLAAQSHVAVSFEVPEYTASVDAMGALRLLDGIVNLNLKCKYYQASTSELFGGIASTSPQSEATPFYPRSPYAAAKLYAYWATVNYREAYGIFACNGILFNHESSRRGETFVTRKITSAVAKIAKGMQEHIQLGNLNALRDWGYAPEYVGSMWSMLQQDKPDDYVIATGTTYTVRHFVELAFEVIGVKIVWNGEGIDEKGVCEYTSKIRVVVDPRYFRRTEVDLLCGDSTKARKKFGWIPKTTLREIVYEMVQNDLDITETVGKKPVGPR